MAATYKGTSVNDEAGKMFIPRKRNTVCYVVLRVVRGHSKCLSGNRTMLSVLARTDFRGLKMFPALSFASVDCSNRLF